MSLSKDILFTRHHMTKEKLINVRVTETTLRELVQVASVLDVPYSQIVRDAIREKCDRLKDSSPAVKEIFRKTAGA